jgi:hypothetical protein
LTKSFFTGAYASAFAEKEKPLAFTEKQRSISA